MFKKFFIQLKLKKLLKSVTKSEKSSNKVLLLIDLNHFQKDEVETVFYSLFNEDYELETIAFSLDKKQIKQNFKHLFSVRDFSFFGNISNEALKHKTNLNYLYVFQLFSNENEYLNYLSAKSKTQLRVGLENSNQQITDLSIKVNDKQLELFFKEAKKYLEIIKKSA